jgi:hypothetical protein
MRTELEISQRIDSLRENILLIDTKIDEELEKNYSKRDYRLLSFLQKERSVWSLAIHHLEWIIE